MNKMVPFGGNGSIANRAALATALQTVAREQSPGGMFLRMGKDGVWGIGADQAPVDDGTEFAINPEGFGHGSIAWGMNSNRLGESFVPLTTPPPTNPPLTEPSTKGWEDQLGMHLRILGSDEDVLYRTSSYGGKAAVGVLAKEVGARLAAGDPQCVAIVTLSNDKYKHDKYGFIYTPVFTIERWITLELVGAPTAPVKGKGTPTAPPKAAKGKAKPATKPARR